MLGRPSIYSDDVARAICARVADGESLNTICADDDMPHRATVFRWLADERHQYFRDLYAEAKRTMADAMAEDILDIADNGTNDYKTGPDGRKVLDFDHIQRSRLRVDTRKWLMAKLMPRKYGDRQALEHSGPDGGDIGHALTVTFQRARNDDHGA